jgi:hypothetical protein
MKFKTCDNVLLARIVHGADHLCRRRGLDVRRQGRIVWTRHGGSAIKLFTFVTDATAEQKLQHSSQQGF